MKRSFLKFFAGLIITLCAVSFAPQPTNAATAVVVGPGGAVYTQSTWDLMRDNIGRILSDPLGVLKDSAKQAAGEVVAVGDKAVGAATYGVLVTPAMILAWFGAYLFDIFAYLSLNGAFYDSSFTGAIYAGWSLLRDLANMLFIFLVIYIGIATILGIITQNLRSLLVKIVLAAVFINFSLVITGILIDASNIAALAFYDAFPPRSGSFLPAAWEAKSLSWPFVQKAGFGGMTTGSWGGITSGIAKGLGAGTLANLANAATLLVVFFVLATAGFLFAIRMVVLVFLMIISPLGIAAYAAPQTEKYFRMWGNELVKNAFWAPLFLILYYIAAQFYVHPNNPLYRAITLPGSSDQTALAQGALSTGGSTLLSSLVTAIVSIIFLVGALIISKKIGAYAADTVISKSKKYAKRGGGFTYRHTIGRGATAELRSERAAGLRRSNTLYGRAYLKTLEAISGAKAGGTKSFVDVRKEREAEIEANVKKDRSNPAGLATYIQNLRGGEQRLAYEKLSAKDRAAVEEHLAPPTYNQLIGGLSPEEREKTEDAVRDRRLGAQSREARGAIDDIAKTGSTRVINQKTKSPYTAKEAVATLKPKDARKLSHEARMSPVIIKELSPRHLADLMSEGNLLPDEIEAIMNVITSSTYPNQAAQIKYVQRPDNVDLWSV